jgi:hypothetical protein
MKMTDYKVDAINNLFSVPNRQTAVLTAHSQISLIEVLTLSITRLCFPSWSWKDHILCDMLIQRVWWHACKDSRTTLLTWVRFLVWENRTFARFVWGRAWIKILDYRFWYTTQRPTADRPGMYHAKSHALGWHTGRDIGRRSRASGESIFEPMFETPADQ